MGLRALVLSGPDGFLVAGSGLGVDHRAAAAHAPAVHGGGRYPEAVGGRYRCSWT